MGGVTKAIGDLTKDVQKTLGKQAELPKSVVDLATLAKGLGQENDKLLAAVKQIADQINGVMQSGSKLESAFDKAKADIAKDGFGVGSGSGGKNRDVETFRKEAIKVLDELQRDLEKQLNSFSEIKSVAGQASKSKGLA